MLKIITPCSRPENVKDIYPTIPQESEWIICFDNDDHIDIAKQILPQETSNVKLVKCPKTGFCGILGRNYVLDNIEMGDDDFILNHDDDNIIHEDLFKNIASLLESNHSIITWGQLHKNNSIRLHPTPTPKVCHIDTACYMIKWGINKYVRHMIDEYTHDGIYAEECSRNGSIFAINKYLSYYNYLNH
jgi:hypothetical protein